MTKLDDIEKAIVQLSPEEVAKLAAWFEAFQEQRFDEKIERDAEAGKLDRLAARALENLEAGGVRDL